jgi:hypothetical protein
MANWDEDDVTGELGLDGDFGGDDIADDGGFGAATDLYQLASS